MSECAETFEVKEGDKDKNNKSISFCLCNEKLLETINLFGLRLKI